MKGQIHILILEDNASDCELVKRELRNICPNYTVEWAHDKETFLRALGNFTPDLILLDYSLPGFDGLSALAVCRQRFPDIPAIIVSGAIGEEVAIETLKAGATDYVLKQHLSRLGPVIQRALQEAEQLTQRRRAEKEIQAINEILKIANSSVDLILLRKRAVDYLRVFSLCSAVGIRLLDEEGNIPYQAYDGFSQSFYESESPLSIKSDKCMCINVIKGDIDPKLPFYTKGGSFYMNGTTKFLATVSEEDKGQTRNVCNQVGYESVALIPIRFENGILGLIQLSDPKENMVPLNMVETVETIAMQLGTAIVRVKARQALKENERELRKARDELEQRVMERTAELSRAKEAAEAAAEAKAAFLSNMSHELRTPLNAVIGFSSLLLADNLTQAQKEYIERIRKGGEDLLSIIADILEFSRAEKEKITLELQPLGLKACVEESLDMVAVQADKKGLNLAYTVAYGTPDAIIGDYGRIRHILVNLLSNAVKFTDKGDISVSVSSKIIEGNKRQITIAVKDTGIGMPQDKMDRLFKPFTQLEYVISRKRDGAGLGLAISKKLVELMGGEIWAESEEGKGSTFRFTIPVEIITGKQLDLGEKGRAKYENLSDQKPLSILVAEDNPSNQRVLVEMLKQFGYRADAVADGVEVLQALQIRPYDLVFMDIRMPEMDGLTATREIRKLWPDDGPKVVAITAFAMDGDQEKCLEAGMDGYIAKPVKVDDLGMLLRNITSAQ